MATGQPKAPGPGGSTLESRACVPDGVQESGRRQSRHALLFLGVQGDRSVDRLSGIMKANQFI